MCIITVFMCILTVAMYIVTVSMCIFNSLCVFLFSRSGQSLYELLEIQKDATDTEIKRAYRRVRTCCAEAVYD